MRRHFVTYATSNYRKSKLLATFFAKFFGGFDEINSYSELDIDKEFYCKNKLIFDTKKGAGLWLWKPYVIKKELDSIGEGEYLFYADAGSVFVKNSNYLFSLLEKSGQDIIAFDLPLIEKQWTKDKVIKYFNVLDNDFSNQVSASFILLKKSKFTCHFFEQYLAICQDKSLIDSTIGNDELDIFIEHRNDQSLFSLLYKSYNLISFKDPTQYGEYPERYSGLVGGEYSFFSNNSDIKMYSNGRMLRIKEYPNDYPTALLHIRQGSIYRYLLSYLKSKIRRYEIVK